MPIRAVFFDLDGTLYDRDATLSGILVDQCRVFVQELRAIPLAAFVARVTALDNHGYCRTRVVYDAVVQELGLDQSLAERLTAHYWAHFDEHCRPFPDVVWTLEELRRQGRALGIVTNGTAAFQGHKVDVLGLRHLVDAVLVSETEGIAKPKPEIFERAATRVGVRSDECCFVGDHPSFDVAGAAAAGMVAVWKHTPYWSLETPAPTIRAIGELVPLLEGRADLAAET